MVFGKSLKEMDCPLADNVVRYDDIARGECPQNGCDDVVCVYEPAK